MLDIFLTYGRLCVCVEWCSCVPGSILSPQVGSQSWSTWCGVTWYSATVWPVAGGSFSSSSSSSYERRTSSYGSIISLETLTHALELLGDMPQLRLDSPVFLWSASHISFVSLNWKSRFPAYTCKVLELTFLVAEGLGDWESASAASSRAPRVHDSASILLAPRMAVGLLSPKLGSEEREYSPSI
jgi:hypothetical protein